MKFFILLTVFIFVVLATNEDAGRKQCTLDKFVIKPTTIDDLFKATPIALKQKKGCKEYLAEMKEQGKFMAIDSKHAAYQLMDSAGKRQGL
jgi:hypothetical protein